MAKTEMKTVEKRGMWTGQIGIGLINVDVKLVPASDSKQIKLRMLSRNDNAPVKLQKVSSTTGTVLAAADIVKGFEVEKGKFVTFEEDELASLRTSSDKMVKIITFVDKGDIDPLLHDANYIAVPDKNTDAYAIMLRALEKSKKAGVGTVTIRQKQHPAIVYAHDGGIVVTTLCHDDEVIHPKNLAAVREIPTPKKEMVDLAVEIVENLSGEFKLGDIRDESRIKMEAMIAAKKAGKKITASEIPTTVPAPADNLMETLKAAAKATKKKGK